MIFAFGERKFGITRTLSFRQNVVPVSLKEEREEKTGFACCLFVKINIPVASADMRRHSDTLRGAQRR